jgi:hypothetical protein
LWLLITSGGWTQGPNRQAKIFAPQNPDHFFIKTLYNLLATPNIPVALLDSQKTIPLQLILSLI